MYSASLSTRPDHAGRPDHAKRPDHAGRPDRAVTQPAEESADEEPAEPAPAKTVAEPVQAEAVANPVPSAEPVPQLLHRPIIVPVRQPPPSLPAPPDTGGSVAVGALTVAVMLVLAVVSVGLAGLVRRAARDHRVQARMAQAMRRLTAKAREAGRAEGHTEGFAVGYATGISRRIEE